MKFKEVKPDVYKFTLEGVDFLFRIWEDNIMGWHDEAGHNVSFKYGIKDGRQFRYDAFFLNELKKDKDSLEHLIEWFATMLARKYKKSCQ